MKLPPIPPRLAAFLQRMRPYALPLIVSSILGWLVAQKIIEDGGQPGMPLDDSYIHFVYARRFAEGVPFTFGLGDGFSSGATSFLWPLLLTPFYLIGFRGLSLIYVVWVIGTLLHAAVAVETKRLAEGIAGRAAAIGAAAMCLLFGGFAWFAWSGMETMALAWAMTRTMRMASELAETSPQNRTRRQAVALGIMAAVTSLVRPEGGAVALLAAIAIVLFTSKSTDKRRALLDRLPALLPIAAIAWVPIANTLMVGHARSTTAIVKWAFGNPYYPPLRLFDFVTGNIRMLWEDLLEGGPYTAIFLPEFSRWAFAAGAVSLVVLAFKNDRAWRAVFIAALVLGTLIPCTFITILWNRVRYIWPFAPGWFVLVACLGAVAGRITSRYAKEAAFVPGLVTGIYAGALAGKLKWSIDDLANSSRAITQQQVKLGVWAEQNLPKDALIGLNDTGAIAYFSERRTFDVVGLTTESEAKYWVAGAGSRYEHYEEMPRERLPTHFIVYPQWFACPSVLGEQLYEATVTNQSILGGASKVVYEADWSVLGRGERPTTRDRQSALVDVLDVSNLGSEQAHDYVLYHATELDNLVTTQWGQDGVDTSDGGRLKRYRDTFTLDFEAATEAPFLVARLAAAEPITLNLSIDGEVVYTFELPATPWTEVEFKLPAQTGGKRVIEVDSPSGAMFGSMHYWLFAE